MRVNRDFILRNIGDEYILVPVGETALRFNRVINLNEVGAFIWRNLEAGLSREELIRAALAEYDVEEEIVVRDIDAFLLHLKENGIIYYNLSES